MSMHATRPAWPFGRTCLRASGVYKRSPLAGTFHEAELAWVPMTSPQQYAQGVQFELPCASPVLVSLSQRHMILAELVRGLRTCVPGLRCVLVRLYGPDFDIQLPADLLAPDVLLVHDPIEVLPALLTAARDNIAIVHQDLRADGTERGGNALSVTLLRPHPASTVSERFAEWVHHNPLLQALDGLKLETLGNSYPS